MGWSEKKGEGSRCFVLGRRRAVCSVTEGGKKDRWFMGREEELSMAQFQKKGKGGAPYVVECKTVGMFEEVAIILKDGKRGLGDGARAIIGGPSSPTVSEGKRDGEHF